MNSFVSSFVEDKGIGPVMDNPNAPFSNAWGPVELPEPSPGWGHHPTLPKPAPGWGHHPGSFKDLLLRPGQEGTFGPIGPYYPERDKSKIVPLGGGW
jgi:hypothetical protein